MSAEFKYYKESLPSRFVLKKEEGQKKSSGRLFMEQYVFVYSRTRSELLRDPKRLH